MTEAEKQVAAALIEECRRHAYVWDPNEGIPNNLGMGLGVDGDVDFERLAKAAIEVIKRLLVVLPIYSTIYLYGPAPSEPEIQCTTGADACYPSQVKLARNET